MVKSNNSKSATFGVVSIVTPVFNAEKYLQRYFEGILVQDYPQIELVLINDGSTDSSEQIMLSSKVELEKAGITVILLKQKNLGAAAAVKSGIEVASGEFLIWPDADDVLLPGSISKRVSAIVHSRCDAVVSDSYLSDDPFEYNPSGLKFTPPLSADRRLRVKSAIDGSFSVQPVGAMVRRRALEVYGVIDNFYISSAGQNYQIFIPLLYNLNWFKLNEVLQVILVHSTSFSRRHRSFIQSLRYAKETRRVIDKTIYSAISDRSDYLAFIRLSEKIYLLRILKIFVASLGGRKFFRALKGIFH